MLGMCTTQDKANVVPVAQCSFLSLFSGTSSDIIYSFLPNCVATGVCLQVWRARFQALCQDTREEKSRVPLAMAQLTSPRVWWQHSQAPCKPYSSCCLQARGGSVPSRWLVPNVLLLLLGPFHLGLTFIKRTFVKTASIISLNMPSLPAKILIDVPSIFLRKIQFASPKLPAKH